ncbi:MAG: Adenylate cyclase [Candidatus Ozemobacter sibiricus]|jgi:class 3 adenylate cyclase|uniref:Adenylate cyclase n=1 Tax=Candidatus Ozemobacter sibiricus TaxID=2268124 RepID=A0A367ZJD1_9BACT|nr:MAG: Adenylate cyclase [Candidatus Ozemobacter sibiricus]
MANEGITRPSGAATDLERRVDYLEGLLRLGEDIDHLIEGCLKSQKDLASTLEAVFDFLEERLAPAAIFLFTQNEDLRPTFYGRRLTEEALTRQVPQALSVTARLQQTVDDRAWFIMPLDMAGDPIGAFGLAFPAASAPAPDAVFRQMDLVAEELDNYFFGIQESRYKHMNIMEIQRCLKARSLSEAIDTAVSILADVVPMEEFVLLYLDEDLAGAKVVQYLVYRGFKKEFDSIERPLPELDALIKRGVDVVRPGNRDLEAIFPASAMTETILLDGLVEETLVGKLMIKPPSHIGLSIASREMIQVFAEALRQRLVDFNREKNMLRQFFPADVIRRMMREPNYRTKYLSPRKADIGILFADVSGFTKLSEQVLRDPARIARFIDGWSSGGTERFFPLGGTLDKLVGDCLIALFGPPFYDKSPAQIALDTLRSAVAIRSFTREYLASPANADIQASPFYRDFGVAIGLNYCSADVGLIGPNQDLTAFSSGMNNTARLQGLAKVDEILVFPPIKDLVQAAEPGRWEFAGPFTASVKNVAEPISYFKLVGEPR